MRPRMQCMLCICAAHWLRHPVPSCTGIGHDERMTGDWARLGTALKAARVLRGLEQRQVAATLGKGRGAIRNIENGDIKSITPTVVAYARLVGWTTDSVERVLGGGEPVMREARQSDSQAAEAISNATGPGPTAPTDLSLRVLQALADGPLIDSQVITVPTRSGGEVRAAIVVRGAPDASPEELQQALEEWRERERALRRGDEGAEAGT